jgi:hypothetical protein
VQTQLFWSAAQVRFGAVEHEPQTTLAPQLLTLLPQTKPAQVVAGSSAVQEQLDWSAEQSFGRAHPPHDTLWPQLLVAKPQTLPAQVVA